MTRALVIANRKARQGDSSLEAGLTVLRESGIETDVHRPGNPGNLPDILKQHGKAADIVVLGGGDGTISLAAPGLVKLGKPIGLLPMGTANDLARTLAIPDDIQTACRIIAGGHTASIDLGRCNGNLFFNVASMGLSVGTARRLTGDVKRKWGVLGYAKALWDTAKASNSFRAQIEVDGEFHDLRAIQVAVGNGRFYGGGMTVEEGAAIDDATFHIYAIRPVGFWYLLALSPLFRWGRQRISDDVLTLAGKDVKVETKPSRSINTDGEVTTKTPATFEMLAGALEIFVPPGPKPGVSKDQEP